MLRPLLVAAMVAAACSAADDLVVLRDGTTLVGTVVTDDEHHVVLVIDQGHQVTMDRAQVGSVKRGGAPERTAPVAPAASPVERKAPPRRRVDIPSEERPWTLGMVLAGGWASGSLTSDGSLLDTGTATTYALDGDNDFGGTQALPGLALRLTHDVPAGQSGLRLGLQGSTGSASGDSASLTLNNVSALAGWTWGTPTRRHAIQGLVGWNSGTMDRDLVLKNGAGTVLAEVSDSTELSGYNLGIEAETAWLRDYWTFGLLAGLSWSSLSGDASWTSGAYRGEESIDGSLMSLYAGGFIGLRF